MKRLLIDAGNTNIKLAYVDGEHWCEPAISPIATVPTGRVAELNLADCTGADEVWVSNVAGFVVARRIVEACAALRLEPRFVTAAAVQCGVSNGYENPEQLGSDRWAALVAAWHHVGRACLVVGCGTATTIDALSDSGEFIGGLILPGVELMQRSLSAAAAGLQQGAGEYAAFPRNTADAMLSGAIQASCGAIRRQHELLGVANAPVLMSGGAAGMLSAHLDLEFRMLDNLVLQGLLLIARDKE